MMISENKLTGFTDHPNWQTFHLQRIVLSAFSVLQWTEPVAISPVLVSLEPANVLWLNFTKWYRWSGWKWTDPAWALHPWSQSYNIPQGDILPLGNGMTWARLLAKNLQSARFDLEWWYERVNKEEKIHAFTFNFHNMQNVHCQVGCELSDSYLTKICWHCCCLSHAIWNEFTVLLGIRVWWTWCGSIQLKLNYWCVDSCKSLHWCNQQRAVLEKQNAGSEAEG